MPSTQSLKAGTGNTPRVSFMKTNGTFLTILSFTQRYFFQRDNESFEDRGDGAQVSEGDLGAVDEGGAGDELGGGGGGEERPPADLLVVGAEQGRGRRGRGERCGGTGSVLGDSELVEEDLLADGEGDGLHERVREGEVRDGLARKVLGLAARDGVGAPEQVVAQREAAKRHVELWCRSGGGIREVL